MKTTDAGWYLVQLTVGVLSTMGLFYGDNVYERYVTFISAGVDLCVSAESSKPGLTGSQTDAYFV